VEPTAEQAETIKKYQAMRAEQSESKKRDSKKKEEPLFKPSTILHG
jgi:hypothetical protein